MNANVNNANNGDSAAHSFISKDGALNTRGRVLDESREINAGFYSRADRGFFTNSGLLWDLKLVNDIPISRLPFYASVERLLLASTPSSFPSANSAAAISPAIGVS